jgi:hypothetical protein
MAEGENKPRPNDAVPYPQKLWISLWDILASRALNTRLSAFLSDWTKNDQSITACKINELQR